MNEMEIEDEIQKIYEGNPSLQIEVNVNPKNVGKKMKDKLQKSHVQKNHISFYVIYYVNDTKVVDPKSLQVMCCTLLLHQSNFNLKPKKSSKKNVQFYIILQMEQLH
jgi:hypothetical protein